MKTLKILHMYADMLDLYGDSGNMEILGYRCRMRGIGCETDRYSVDSEIPDFSSYDLIYIGGGADLEQQHIAADLLRCRAGIEKAYKDGVFLFLICGGYQLMGKFYRDADGNDIPGLGLFDYHTIAPESRKKRCIGNIVIRTEITGKAVDIVGFENHGGQTVGVKTPFGNVLYGNGNCSKSESEGYFEKNVIDIINKYSFQNSCVVTSQIYEVLKNVKEYDFHIKTFSRNEYGYDQRCGKGSEGFHRNGFQSI